MGNVQTTGRPESDYVAADIVPIIIVLIIGIIVIGIIICAYFCKCCCCKSKPCYTSKCCRKICPLEKFANYLIRFLYGGPFAPDIVTLHSKQREQGLFIDNIRVEEKLTWLKCMLVTNAASLFTLVGMVFCDLYFIESDFGCIPDEDCYPSNEDYHEHPLGENCSLYADRNITTICYRFNLSFLNSIGSTGGILLIATILIAILTQILIQCQNCCHFKIETRCQPQRGKIWTIIIYFFTIFVGMVLIVLISVAIVYIHKLTLSEITMLRLAGYIFQYVSVLLSLLLTIVTPWYTLIQSQPLGPIYLTLERENGEKKYSQQPIGPMYLIPINKANNIRREYRLRYEGNGEPPPNPIYLTKFYHKTNEIPSEQLAKLNEKDNWTNLPPPEGRSTRLYSIHFQGPKYPTNDTSNETRQSSDLTLITSTVSQEKNTDLWVGPININCKNLGPIYMKLEREQGAKVERYKLMGPVYLVPIDGTEAFQLRYQGNEQLLKNNINLVNFYYTDEQPGIFDQEAKWAHIIQEKLYSMHFRDNVPQGQTEFKLRNADINNIEEHTIKLLTDETVPGFINISIKTN